MIHGAAQGSGTEKDPLAWTSRSEGLRGAACRNRTGDLFITGVIFCSCWSVPRKAPVQANSRGILIPRDIRRYLEIPDLDRSLARS